MVYYGISWYIMVSHGILWYIAIFYGISWYIIVLNEVCSLYFDELRHWLCFVLRYGCLVYGDCLAYCSLVFYGIFNGLLSYITALCAV